MRTSVDSIESPEESGLTSPPAGGWRSHAAFVLVCVAGLAVRLAILPSTAETQLQIVDEQHYHSLATNVRHGNGFCFEAGSPTSMRPPLYPAFIAAVWAVTGSESLQAVRLAQIAITILNAIVLYRLGLRLLPRRAALFAAGGFLFYPSLVLYDFQILTEALFTLLLTLFASLYVGVARDGKPLRALMAGCVLGLAALTRSVLWPFPFILCPATLFFAKGTFGARSRIAALLFFGYAIAVGPWAVRNTLLQKTFTVIDTMGGMNLCMGNYEFTPMDRPWDAVSLTDEKSWSHDLKQLKVEHPEIASWTDGQKDKWGQQRAIAFMKANPGLTLRRAVIKFCDFWGLEREYVAAIQRGLYRPPSWLGWPAALSIVAGYAAVMLLASLGLFLAPPEDRKAHLFFLLVMVFICGLHTVVFGHSRYHVPLIPFLLLYAAAAVNAKSWRRLRDGFVTAAGPVLCMLALLSIWAREIFLRDFDRVREIFHSIFR